MSNFNHQPFVQDGCDYLSNPSYIIYIYILFYKIHYGNSMYLYIIHIYILICNIIQKCVYYTTYISQTKIYP